MAEMAAARAEKGDDKGKKSGRRLVPSGFDLQHGSATSLPPQKQPDSEAGDAFQRKIPSMKKKLQDPVPAIVAGLQEHAAHPGVVQAACKALFHLSEADDENDIKIANSIKLIFSCLRTHQTVADVQEQGCRLIKNLAASSEILQRSIAFEGGIKVVLDAMRTHLREASVIVFAYGALLNLIGDNHYNKSAVASEGGIRTVIEVMQAHPKNTELQASGCAVIMSLAYNHADNQRKVVSEGGIEEILKTMQAHQNDVKVQELGCGALDNIAWSDAALRKRVKDAGALDVVEAAIARHFMGTTAACERYAEHLIANLDTV